MIKQSDSLEFLKTIGEYENDIIYADPPYALGSEIIIRSDGMVDYKKANDFMNKWSMPTGDYWNAWFKEAYKTLKHGGYLIMFGMDRQLLLFKYYANLAGFKEQQSLYWYFISNFPKATDLSKMIDKNAGAERNIVEVKGNKNNEVLGITKGVMADNNAITELAKKYEGYKYSISPLKQTNETIMVFQKPYKSGSCLHDTLLFENGDNECRCGALNIDGNRVEPTSEKDLKDIRSERPSKTSNANEYTINHGKLDGMDRSDRQEVTGRYPSQTFCDSNTAEVLDKQSGAKCGAQVPVKSNTNNQLFGNEKLSGDDGKSFYQDTGGCSKILHKCDFQDDEHDIYFYQPKVSKSERNAGCDEFEEQIKGYGNLRSEANDNFDNKKSIPVKNIHPTLKPIALNYRILKLFKTPNDQRICFPFAGSGSEIIGGIKAGFTNWTGCEINQEYIDIANARIEYWTKQFEEEAHKDKQITIDDLLDK